MENPLLVKSFTISQEDFDTIKNENGEITVVINYYYDDPAGYEIVMSGNGDTTKEAASKVICARPCPTYNPPTNP